MTNTAKDAYRVATHITKIYTRLGTARDAIALALDEAPLGFDDDQFKRLNELRNAISREMGLINDFSKREAHRICNQPEPSPTPHDHECPQIGPCPFCHETAPADDPKDSLRFPVEPETLNEALDVAYTATEILCEMESNQRQSDPNETLIKSQLFNEYIRTKKSTCDKLIDKLKQILGIR